MKNSRFWIKLRSWEYWPLNVVYTPIYLYWLWLGAKAGTLMFFEALNPGIKHGGLYGDSKKDILALIPEAYLPRTIFVPKGQPLPKIVATIAEKGISYPIIAKPDIGERGFLVEKLADEAALKAYLEKAPMDLIIQDFVAYPEEISVLYYRFPHETSGHITSITLKKYLSVTGDGTSTVRELVEAYPRAYLQLPTLESRHPELLDTIPLKGEELELVPYGNHCRGAMFLDGNDQIDAQLIDTFDQLSHQMEGVFFGRYDIKCQSMQALKEGRDFAILEFNGAKAEPTHIYQPGFSMLEAYRVLFRQWNTVYALSKANMRLGFRPLGLFEGLREFFAVKRYKKEALKNYSALMMAEE